AATYNPSTLGIRTNMSRNVGTSTGKQLKPGARVRFVGDTIVPASPSYPARVEVDNAPSGLNLLEVGFDRDNDGRFDENEIKTLRGHREMHVRLPAFAPDGVLSFKTEVRDWTTTFDITEVYNTHTVRVRLFNEDEKKWQKILVPAPVAKDNKKVDNVEPVDKLAE